MRITNNSLLWSQLQGLQSGMAAVNKAQEQVSSGKKIQAASDDPHAATEIMQSSTSLRAIDQYKRNVDSVSSRLSAEDTALQQLGDLITRAKELSVQEASANNGTNTRAAALAEAKELLKSAVDLGNTKLGADFIFGGDASTTQPFTSLNGGTDYASTNATGQRAVQVSAGRTMSGTNSGKEVFVDSGVLDSLKSLVTSLSGGTSADITASGASLDAAFSNVQQFTGDVGARSNQIDMIKSNLDAFSGYLTTYKSNLQDVDVEAAVTELMTRQNAYQAAMLATSKVMGLTLSDYLR